MYKLVYNKLQKLEPNLDDLKKEAHNTNTFISHYIRALQVDLFDLDSILYAKLDFNILDNTKIHAVNRIHNLIKTFAD